jgi:hypothetical protein
MYVIEFRMGVSQISSLIKLRVWWLRYRKVNLEIPADRYRYGRN